jgi:hypothetical protein
LGWYKKERSLASMLFAFLEKQVQVGGQGKRIGADWKL